ncbi:MAG: hypothetical protein OXF66_05560 [Gammaproteobacteria bacterium]|nr:hypothetical protein [Gammaproteobacteria bacterium]MCY4164562.1 hypothetical protein [Gammaproteobacteria bacterium]MCY4254722.1 hypothetical protein [Gammaproteobacteria bacterium]MCY4339791.1 hypothetical protein [Gammaproteobacteria bacterium]
MKGIKKWSVGVLAACGMLAGLLIASTAHTQGSPNYGVAYRQLHCQGVGTNVVGSYSSNQTAFEAKLRSYGYCFYEWQVHIAHHACINL